MPLFKYMSLEVAGLFVGSLKIRFTQPSALNDPFEFRPLIDFEATANEFRDEVESRINEMFGSVDAALAVMERMQESDPNYPAVMPIQVFRAMLVANPSLGQQFMAQLEQYKSEILQRNTRPSVWEAQWHRFQEAFGGSFGILSLTENSLHTLMWSHYGGQHYGVVVEFDEQHPWFDQRRSPSDEFRHLLRVTYVQNPAPRTWRQLQGADVLYTKHSEWAYEREWRIIRPLRDGTEVRPGIVCFDVPPAAIRALIFGCRTTSEAERDIRAAVSANPGLSHVQFKRVRAVGAGLETSDA